MREDAPADPQVAAIVVRPEGPIALHVQPQQLRDRLEHSRARLDVAVQRFKREAQALSPNRQIRDQPVAWAMRAFAVGLALGWLTAPRSRTR